MFTFRRKERKYRYNRIPVSGASVLIAKTCFKT